MALSRGGAEGRTAGPLGFGPHLRPLCGPPLQQQHDFWSSPVSVGSLGTPWSFVIILRATPSAPPWASPRYTARSLHLQNGQWIPKGEGRCTLEARLNGGLASWAGVVSRLSAPRARGAALPFRRSKKEVIIRPSLPLVVAVGEIQKNTGGTN